MNIKVRGKHLLEIYEMSYPVRFQNCGLYKLNTVCELYTISVSIISSQSEIVEECTSTLSTT